MTSSTNKIISFYQSILPLKNIHLSLFIHGNLVCVDCTFQRNNIKQGFRTTKLSLMKNEEETNWNWLQDKAIEKLSFDGQLF